MRIKERIADFVWRTRQKIRYRLIEYLGRYTTRPAYRTRYDDGERTHLMPYATCKEYADIFGGVVEFCPEDYLKYKRRIQSE